MEQKIAGDLVVDVKSVSYGSGFKFNSFPFGGMTVEAGNAVKLQSPAEIQLAPADQKPVILATTGALPSAVSALRGALFVVRGAGGVADTLQVCLKSAADTYSWKTISTG